MSDINSNKPKEREDLFDRDVLITQRHLNDDLKHTAPTKSIAFKAMIVIMVFLIISILYRGIVLAVTNDYLFRSVLNNDAPEMPAWYPSVTIFLGVIALIGVFMVAGFKKWGVYMTLTSLFLSAVLQPEFMADGTLFTLFALFVFIGYGLAIIYPYWYKFK